MTQHVFHRLSSVFAPLFDLRTPLLLCVLAGGVAATPRALAATTDADALDTTSTPNFRGAWVGTSTYAVNDEVSYAGGLYLCTAPTAPVTTTTTTPGSGNLFDKSAVMNNTVILSTDGTTVNIGGFQSTGYVNISGASSFVTNITINVFEPYGVAFYDANKTFISGTRLNGNGLYPAGAPITLPAGAMYARFWWQLGYMGTTVDAAIVNTGTLLQSAYSSFGASGPGNTTTTTTPSAAPSDTTHWTVVTTTTTPAPAPTTGTGPWAGKKMFVLGDSIVWENPVVAGQIASAVGATLSSQGATAPGVDAFPGRTFDHFTNGQSGSVALPVSASVIADVDLMLIELGTNQDSNAGIGSVTDTPSFGGSMSAQMRAMLETIMGWKPGMRIVVVGPYQSNRYNVQAGTDGIQGAQDANQTPANAGSLAVLRNVNAAMKAVCNLYSIPYIDMYDESGVNFSTSAIWLKDGLHPNTTGYGAFFVPYIAAQLPRFAH